MILSVKFETEVSTEYVLSVVITPVFPTLFVAVNVTFIVESLSLTKSLPATATLNVPLLFRVVL